MKDAKSEGRRAKGEGRRAKGEERRAKSEGRRAKSDNRCCHCEPRFVRRGNLQHGAANITAIGCVEQEILRRFAPRNDGKTLSRAKHQHRERSEQIIAEGKHRRRSRQISLRSSKHRERSEQISPKAKIKSL